MKLNSWKGTVRIGAAGTSLIVRVTDAAKMLDLERGDPVQITLKKIEEDEEE